MGEGRPLVLAYSIYKSMCVKVRIYVCWLAWWKEPVCYAWCLSFRKISAHMIMLHVMLLTLPVRHTGRMLRMLHYAQDTGRLAGACNYAQRRTRKTARRITTFGVSPPTRGFPVPREITPLPPMHYGQWIHHGRSVVGLSCHMWVLWVACHFHLGLGKVADSVVGLLQHMSR